METGGASYLTTVVRVSSVNSKTKFEKVIEMARHMKSGHVDTVMLSPLKHHPCQLSYDVAFQHDNSRSHNAFQHKNPLVNSEKLAIQPKLDTPSLFSFSEIKETFIWHKALFGKRFKAVTEKWFRGQRHDFLPVLKKLVLLPNISQNSFGIIWESDGLICLYVPFYNLCLLLINNFL